MKPLAIDLYCGLGGWTEGLLAEGYDVIGFDIVQRPYPAQLVIQDVRELDGSRFAHATVIVASPPCDEFSRWDQPWSRLVAKRTLPDLSLWRAAERIAREAHVPTIIENVRGAQRFVGPARAHFGRQYLWGDVPPLLPHLLTQSCGRQKQSLSSSRKAERAKIPFELASWIARCYKPLA